MEELISIIVPIYNIDQYLEKCLNSIISQSYKKLDIILIDDGSVDKSSMICDKYAEMDSRITVIHKKNEGVSAARNEGIETARGRYFTFVDGDDFVDCDYIQTLCDGMNNILDMSVCSFRYIGKKNSLNKKSYSEIKTAEQLKLDVFCNKNCQGMVFGKLFKKDIADEYNIRFRRDIFIYEDMLFCMEYLKHCSNVYYTSKKTYNYVVRVDSAMNRSFDMKHMSALTALNLMNDNCTDDEQELKTLIKQLYVTTSILMIRKMAYSDVKPDDAMIKNLMKASKESCFLRDKRASLKYKASLIMIGISVSFFQRIVKKMNL